jgi:acetoin utilization deacetylase AcuC-like enzyme
MTTTAYITHPVCKLHDMGAGHPESPQRLAAIKDRLIASGIDNLLIHHEAPLITREALLRVHRESYVDEIDAKAPHKGMVQLDPDTSMNPHSLEAARRAAGAVVLGVDLVMTAKVKNAFCAVRPPGHHALSNRSMGFCIFNNVAVAAAHARAAHGIKRVAILDFDVHHGNGTEEIFADEPNVMLCSTFQHPYYPYQGADTISDHIINTPISANAGGEEFRAAVLRDWIPNVKKFAPELILISAGFDAHKDDPLAYLKLTEDDYGWVTAEIVKLANEFSKGRIVSTLEGGYNLDALGRSVTEHIRVLIGSATS